MKFLPIILLATVLLSACSSKKKEAELLELSKPQWLKERPVSSTYFYGIGTTPKVGGTSYYKEQAKEKALADLSKQINTKIKSEQSLYRMEDNKGVYEYIQSRVKATSNEFLEGYEFVDQWEDLDYCYSYYRLSKSKFYALKAKRKQEALELSFQKYKQAKMAQQNNDFILALEQYAAGIDAMSGYLNEQTMFETAAGNIDLFEVNKDALSDLISGLKITYDTESMSIKALTKVPEETSRLTVTCFDRPAKNIPVRFNYSGGFLVTDKYKSSTKGTIPSPTFTMTNNTEEILKASIDLKSLGRQITKNLIVRQLVEKQKTGNASLVVSLKQ
ncbi:LPP20 family lipoprotein [Carboxylicivirga sp. A043]|uniref:LPP20 family lipoprotein n=1 Tax=Carboxylicivirga litoralis TaxID=2816963 RepID=UPI0021CAEA3C|nr:LPP20 family lipoprotein [Carboxylicivirga sp. A043]MCU4157556.1 LPP20 family lipoprotein [Carboxylicivirga sp. A043]